jgi:hypothetical protein
MKALLDYRFDRAAVANPDGSFPMEMAGTTTVQEAINSQLGPLAAAADLGAAGKGIGNIQNLPVNLNQFCVRVVVRADAAVTARQNLVESNRLPFSLFLDKGARADEFVAVASVRSAAHDWQSATTRFQSPLKPNTWYTIDLVYDIDTLALFVDGEIASVQAFPRGRVSPLPGRDLFLGVWVDGARHHFDGKVAALQLWDGIPEKLEQALDERRGHPEWFISHKRLAVMPHVNLGAPAGAVVFDAAVGAYSQPHEQGLVMYRDGLGTAFEMHGAIHRFYAGFDRKADLGYLTSDERTASRSRGGRKNTFSSGAIYWSAGTGPVPVLDRIYLSYEDIVGVDLIGFPLRPAAAVPGGLEQEFQSGRMYHRAGEATAHEVHGAILARFLQLGGVGRWGFPVSDEQAVLRDGQSVGRLSEFENATFYWSPATGAFEVHGDIRKRYQDLRGPAGELGFPTSDELDIPGVAGARFNTFQNGSLCWYGNAASLVHVRPFTIFLDRIETKESEGFGMGQNDIYLREVKVEVGGATVYNRRHPQNGDFGGRNVVEVDLHLPPVIVPNRPDAVVRFTVDVWDSDPGNDDHLGRLVKELGPADAWGLRDNQGVFNSGAFQKIKAILWSVQPQVDPAALTEPEKFWGARNRGTPEIPFQRYAAAFRDVDSDAEWWDVTDWLERAFYELVVDTLASSGNCFGMALESIHARKGLSRFGLPLNRFNNWPQLEPEFNVKHCYQVGASAIWWFVGQFLTGNTHDPKDVFRKSRSAFLQGRHPVLCISQNYDFSGSPHCVLPVGWDDSVRPWRIDICDPNFPNALRQLTVNPDDNTYSYVVSATKKYEGGEWSGGRLHYMPFNVLDRPPRTPVWDAILLLLAGTVIILGSDAETESITDPDGNDLNAHGDRAKQKLQRRERIDDCFVGFKGFDGRGTVAGDILMKIGPPPGSRVRPPIAVDPGLFTRERFGAVRGAAARHTEDAVREAVAGRSVARVLADPTTARALAAPVLEALRAAAVAAKPGDFIHKVAGLRTGTLNYVMRHGLSEMQLSGPVAERERNEIRVRDAATSTWSVAMTGGRDKRMKLVFESKLGTGRDRVRLTLDQVPATAAKGLEMNLNPGLGGLDLVNGAGSVEVPVIVRTVIDGRVQERRFNMPMQDGVRVRLSSVLSNDTLSVARIPQLFAPATGSRILRPQ